MLDHVSIQCADPAASAAFYDAVLAPVGGGRAMDFGAVIGYGIGGKPEFWLGPHSTGEGFRESHLAFEAAGRAAAGGPPGVSKHLRVLSNAGLIEHRSVGTRNLYLLAPGGMAAAQQWLVQTWDTALAAYAAEVRQVSKERR